MSASSVEVVAAEAYRVLAHYMRSADSQGDAEAAARADLAQAAREVARLAGGNDLIKVISSVRVAMVMATATTGIHPPAAALELIALILVDRDANPSLGEQADVGAAFMPLQIAEAAQKLLSTGSVLALLDMPPSDPESTLVFYSVQREIHLRNPVYPHMLLDTLRDLFSDRATSADCRAVLGFTGLEAVEVMNAVGLLAGDELKNRFARMETARGESLPHILSWRAGDRQQEPTDDQRTAMQAVVDALQDLTTNVAEATIIDPDAVAARTGHSRSVVEAVLDAFTLTAFPDLSEVLDRFFRGDNPLRTAPVVRDSQGRRMLVHEALALPAVREVIETRLKAANREESYKRHRGASVETAAIDMLASALPGSTAYRAFNYFVPDPNAVAPQLEPESFTKRVEADGLILIDDVAIIIEVKSVALTAEARGGVARRLRGKLREIVTSAADQAGRLRERIVVDQRIRLDDHQWIDVTRVREIHTVAVGLEDLSGVTTATTMLVAAGVIKPDNIPWTVSIHDMRIVCELTERPSELLLYLRRRTEPLATWKFRAVDELDLYLHFLERGLYVEPDPQQTAANVPWAGTPSPSDLRRFSEQRPEVLASRTDPLDAWYTAQLGQDAPPAEKPRLVADRRILQLIDMIAATGSPGWLSTSTSLLEGNGQVQRTFGRYAADLAKLVRRDRIHHSVTHLLGDTSGRHTLLVWACHGPDEDVATAASYLLPYLQAKKHQAQAHRAACMIFDSTGKQLLRLLYDNRTLGPDPALDAVADRLIPVQAMKRATPQPVRAPKAKKRRR